MNILLVNQEYLQAKDLQKLQESLNVCLYFAVTCNDALRLFRMNYMDVVILDGNRNELDPLIRCIQDTPSKTRIVLTGGRSDAQFRLNLCFQFEGHPSVDELIDVLETCSRAPKTFSKIPTSKEQLQ